MTESDRKMDEMIKAVNAYKNKFTDHDLPPMMGIGFKDEYINKLKDFVENHFISVTQIRKSIMKETLPTPFCAY